VRLQSAKFLRQFGHLERRGGAQAEGARSEPGAGVEINLVGKQVQFCTDAQGRVIDVKLAESGNWFEGRVNAVKQIVEVVSFLYRSRVLREDIERSFKNDFRKAALMRVAFAAAVYREGRVLDCCMKRWLADKPVELGLGTRPDPADISANDSVRLLLYTQKTGVPVNNVLPDFVLKVLDGTPKVAANYYFWDGESKLETIIGSWRKRLNRLFELAEVSSGHPHRFRDTFVVELLLAGVPIERVSILLGHESMRTTERNYAPWVRSRQEQLEADLTRAWGLDPVIAAQTSQARGTRRVHEKKQRSNSHILKRENWRRGWDSNPRIKVLQTFPLGHLGTAPNC
jgi:hypothetical protein